MAHKFQTPILKHSAVFRLELDVHEFLQYSKFVDPEANATEIIERELYHCWQGITSGSFGGEALDWTKVLHFALYEEGHTKQTELGVLQYGDFSKSL